MPSALELRSGLIRRSGVDYYHIGKLSLQVQRFLNALTSRKFTFGPASLAGSFPALLAWSIDENQFIAKSVPPRFYEQRRIQHDRPATRSGGALRLIPQELLDPRMSESFQELSLFDALQGRRKHDLGKRRSIDFAVLPKDSSTPTLDYRPPDLGQTQRVMPGPIGIQNPRPHFRQLQSDQALSAGHPPQQPYNRLAALAESRPLCLSCVRVGWRQACHGFRIQTL